MADGGGRVLRADPAERVGVDRVGNLVEELLRLGVLAGPPRHRAAERRVPRGLRLVVPLVCGGGVTFGDVGDGSVYAGPRQGLLPPFAAVLHDRLDGADELPWGG